MTAPATVPARRRRGRWFADRPIAVKILATVAFSASVGVVLCLLAVGRINALDASQQDLYEGHVVALRRRGVRGHRRIAVGDDADGPVAPFTRSAQLCRRTRIPARAVTHRV